MARGLRLLPWLCLPVLTTGCWDRTEIEERGFVVGTALDQAEGEKIKLTYQMVIPNAMQGKEGEKKQEGKPYLNVAASAHTVFKAARQLANTTSRPPYLEHNRMILISEKLAREGSLADVLDVFIRDAETRRAAKVMIVEGEASALLDVKNSLESLPVQYIDQTASNPDKSAAITPPINIGQVHAFLLARSSYALPKVATLDDEVSTSGAAVFNGGDHRLRGFLNEEETTGRNFVTGTLKAGAIEIKVNGRYLVFEIKRVRRAIRANVSDPTRPRFDIDISVKGNIGESHLTVSLLQKEVFPAVRRQVAAQVEEMAEQVIAKVQREYKSDILGLGKYLDQNHHAAWKKLKDNWDQGECYFAQSEIHVHVQVQVAVIGSILKAE